jgi:hypothetical protein
MTSLLESSTQILSEILPVRFCRLITDIHTIITASNAIEPIKAVPAHLI